MKLKFHIRVNTGPNAGTIEHIEVYAWSGDEITIDHDCDEDGKNGQRLLEVTLEQEPLIVEWYQKGKRKLKKFAKYMEENISKSASRTD